MAVLFKHFRNTSNSWKVKKSHHYSISSWIYYTKHVPANILGLCVCYLIYLQQHCEKVHANILILNVKKYIKVLSNNKGHRFTNGEIII